jgi:hypothetical protein
MPSKWKFITDAVPISIRVSNSKEIETLGPSGLHSQIQLQPVKSENSITEDEENEIQLQPSENAVFQDTDDEENEIQLQPSENARFQDTEDEENDSCLILLKEWSNKL